MATLFWYVLRLMMQLNSRRWGYTERRNMSVAPAPISSTDIGVVRKLEDAIGTVVRGKPEAIRAAVVALARPRPPADRGHPGVGKTTLARALGRVARRAFPAASSSHQRSPCRRTSSASRILRGGTQARAKRGGPFEGFQKSGPGGGAGDFFPAKPVFV